MKHSPKISARRRRAQVYITDDGEFWEQKDLWSLVGDPPLSLRCVSCHAATVPCKYHQEGRCYRGELCAYAHADAHQVVTADNTVAHDRVLDVHIENRHFLSPADFVALKGVSTFMKEVVEEMLRSCSFDSSIAVYHSFG